MRYANEAHSEERRVGKLNSFNIKRPLRLKRVREMGILIHNNMAIPARPNFMIDYNRLALGGISQTPANAPSWSHFFPLLVLPM